MSEKNLERRRTGGGPRNCPSPSAEDLRMMSLLGRAAVKGIPDGIDTALMHESTSETAATAEGNCVL
jgi:hypothetical protein